MLRLKPIRRRSRAASAVPGRSPARTIEGDLLLCCARVALSPLRAECARALIREGPDWPELLRLARRHRLGPLLLRHLARLADPEVPADLLRDLRVDLALNAAHSRVLVETLREILLLLGAHGIDALPYKGPVLAQQLYGDVAFRQMTDLDLLVLPDDVPRAFDLLRGLGYRSAHRLTPRQLKALSRADNNHPLQGEGARPSVELHWALTVRHPMRALDLDELRAGARTVEFAGMKIRAFGTEDLVLVLCFHGMRHMWERLGWLCDLAELLRAGGIDWDRLLARAARFGGRRALLLGLHLARRELDAPVPERVGEMARSDRAVIELARLAMAPTFGPDDRPANSLGVPFHWFQLRAMDRHRERARYLLRAALIATPEDWEAVPLPDALFPMYSVLRPLRLAASYAVRLGES